MDHMEDDEWQISCVELKQRGTKLFENGLWFDVTLLVGPGQVRFQAHKLILSMASPVFESVFFRGEAENDSYNIPDVKPEAFHALLNYVYTENIHIDSFEMAQAVYTCANKYVLLQLSQVCVIYMSCNLTVQNACLAYQIGLMHDEKALVEESLPMIKYHTRDVLNHDSFEQLELRTIESIFSLEGLHVETDLDLFFALERHAKSRFRTPTVDMSAYRGALSHVRFLTLSAEQFAAHAARSPLLARRDALAVLARLAAGDAARLRLPPQLCGSREHRCKLQVPVARAPPLVACGSATFRVAVPLAGGRPQSAASAPAALGGRPYAARARPRLDTSTATWRNTTMHLGVFLRCEQPGPAPWACRAAVDFRLCSPKDTLKQAKLDWTFTSAQRECGFARFLSAEGEASLAAHEPLTLVVLVTLEKDAASTVKA